MVVAVTPATSGQVDAMTKGAGDLLDDLTAVPAQASFIAIGTDTFGLLPFDDGSGTPFARNNSIVLYADGDSFTTRPRNGVPAAEALCTVEWSVWWQLLGEGVLGYSPCRNVVYSKLLPTTTSPIPLNTGSDIDVRQLLVKDTDAVARGLGVDKASLHVAFSYVVISGDEEFAMVWPNVPSPVGPSYARLTDGKWRKAAQSDLCSFVPDAADRISLSRVGAPIPNC